VILGFVFGIILVLRDVETCLRQQIVEVENLVGHNLKKVRGHENFWKLTKLDWKHF
jgi:hypothetical protein